MKMNQKAMNVIKKAGNTAAKVSTGMDCVFFCGQPKMPKTMTKQIASKYNK